MSADSIDAAVTPTDVEFFNRHGWWVAPRLFQIDDRQVQMIMDELTRSNTAVDARDLRHYNYASLISPGCRALAHSSVIAAMAAKLVGAGELRIWNTNLVEKVGPHKESHVGWHADRAYWMSCSSERMITAGIALQDTSTDMGPLKVVDGSHRWAGNSADELRRIQGFRGPQPAGPALAKYRSDFDVVELPLSSGQVTFHHCLLLHGSGENRTSSMRRHLVTHYQDETNCWRHYVQPDGSVAAYPHDSKVRKTAEGFPDYTDPAFCPVVWPKGDR
ncbi:MAG TPA: phytanoyl-CoA dioxygenase family protein [Usitatibacter sp.]|jgi:ectoine hydroxylase-related dioxygenase (phytanoyl-CoA dioxygenase family)|nr:phytanoyl-CoA dioxygenase family protein [Usitatibacter sp.]